MVLCYYTYTKCIFNGELSDKKMNTEVQHRKLWDAQLEILDILDQMCRQNGLHYSLYAGTLIGAVRHQGFIPWDDDLDICMPRKDYEEFLKIWKDQDHPGYVLQNKRNTPSFTQSFSKIRKDHTTFLQFEWEKGRYHTGIFVDIFPIDRCPVSFLKRRFFFWKCMKYQLFTREFTPPKASILTKTVSRVLLALSSSEGRQKYRKHFEQELNRFYADTGLPTVAIETMTSMKRIYSNDMTDNYTDLLFEGKKYQCFSKWDEFLKSKYGDYMKFPPEKERVWKHSHLIIDFNHNYGEES